MKRKLKLGLGQLVENRPYTMLFLLPNIVIDKCDNYLAISFCFLFWQLCLSYE